MRSSSFLNLFHVLFFTIVLSQSDFSHGEFGLPSPGKASCDKVALPKYGACWIFLFFHNPPNSDMDYGIFNVRTDESACDGTPATLYIHEDLKN